MMAFGFERKVPLQYLLCLDFPVKQDVSIH